jgi:hypothetical protein
VPVSILESVLALACHQVEDLTDFILYSQAGGNPMEDLDAFNGVRQIMILKVLNY